MSKYILSVLACGFFLAGCSLPISRDAEREESPPASSVKTQDGEDAIVTDASGVMVAKAGEACDAQQNVLCDEKLVCLDGESIIGEKGTCRVDELRQDDMVCDDNDKNVVCGFRYGKANGYLNECYARKFQAVVLNEGFCPEAIHQQNPCDVPASAEGDCKMAISGFAFDGTSCGAVSFSGCRGTVPFADKATCEQICLGKSVNKEE